MGVDNPVDSGTPPAPPLDCSIITETNPAWEVCDSTETECSGVFTDGAGCSAYCAAAGMVCTARYGGEPGCHLEPDVSIGCDEINGHTSDWCVCGLADGTDTPADDPDPDCPEDPSRPPVLVEIDYRAATYSPRHNWVMDCYPYAYTAAGSEHEACDASFDPDGSRMGTATFLFEDLPPGRYQAYMGGRHTENRNPAGALFVVDGHSRVIDQRVSPGDYLWDYHGEYCLSGDVEVVLDSSINAGSDSVMGIRLAPASR